MDFKAIYERHGEWWLEKHGDDEPAIAAFGLFKAFRNFINPMLKSMQGEHGDYRPKVVEALGDAMMYICAYIRSSDSLKVPINFSVDDFKTAEEAAKNMAFAFFSVLNLGEQMQVDFALSAIVSACRCCAIDPMEAARVSLDKLRSK